MERNTDDSGSEFECEYCGRKTHAKTVGELPNSYCHKHPSGVSFGIHNWK